MYVYTQHITSRFAFLALAILTLSSSICAQQTIRFAVIGDYGKASQPELDVSDLVKSWNPDFMITTGDNNYEYGEASTIDANIGQYYHEFIYPYSGSYGAGDTVNRFFPSLGNHDWMQTDAAPYLNYFTLPGNERYYDFVRGSVHLFCVDSDSSEPDGITSISTQGVWLQSALSSSTSKWNVVYFHHPPYSSGSHHGSALWMRWPFAEWGVKAILNGHEHQYERLLEDGVAYFVVGNCGKDLYPFGAPIDGSQSRFSADFGALLVTANDDSIAFKFFTRGDSLVDSYTILAPPPPPTLSSPLEGSIDQPLSLPLTWNAIATASSYRVQVSTSSSFDSLIIDDSTQTTTQEIVGPLSASATYYWHVRAQNNGGVSAYSPAWTFTTRADSEPSYSMTVQRGWNLLSLPVAAFNANRQSVFPMARSNAFRYDGTGYQRTDTLPPMMGFWLKFDPAQTIPLDGDTLFQDTVELVAGWNLIGTISFPILVSSIVQLPPAVVESNFFGYNNRYVVADTLFPGRGYWVKAEQPGILILQSSGI